MASGESESGLRPAARCPDSTNPQLQPHAESPAQGEGNEGRFVDSAMDMSLAEGEVQTSNQIGFGLAVQVKA